MKNFTDWIVATDTPDESGTELLSQITDDTYLAQRSFRSRRMVPPIPLTDEQLGSLPASTLFLVGEREVIFNPHKAILRLNTVAPQIRTELIPCTGHDFFAARAEIVNRHIIDFQGSKCI